MPPAEANNLKEKLRKLPEAPGVYRMCDRLGSILYIGKAKNLKKRVSSYFQPGRIDREERPKIRAMVKLVHDIEVTIVANEAEAILLEGRLIKEWKPRYNTDFVDDKKFLLLKVDVQSPLPAFRLVRNRLDDRARYFGPFPNATALRRTLTHLKQEYGILTGDTVPVPLEDGRYRLYDDMRGEIYRHPNEVTPEDYRERVERACTFLEGKSKDRLASLEAEMLQAAENHAFEKAAALRDEIFALRETLAPVRRFTGHLPDPGQAAGMRMLQAALDLAQLPRTMECFDISHISGTFCVASMVRFSEGKPDKAQYRRFKIKGFTGNDDFRAMQEVVGRRYRRLHEEARAFPDLVVIDGGVGQVGAALKAFVEAGLEPPPLIGLAKKEETIVFSNGREPLVLPREHAGLRLLQRLRDEAHRFANSFNAELRSKKMQESVLDEVRGLGQKRKAALLQAFGSVAALREASVEALAQVEGIGPKFAAELAAYFATH